MGQVVLGVAGPIASGKTWFCHKLETYLSQYSQVNHISLDNIRRNALWRSMSTRHIELRQRLAEFFKLSIDPNYFFDRTIFTASIFKDEISFNMYRLISTPILMLDVVDVLDDNSINIIEWALLVEEGYTRFMTHQIFYMDTPENIRTIRLAKQNEPLVQQRLHLIHTEYSTGLKVKPDDTPESCLKKIGISYDFL